MTDTINVLAAGWWKWMLPMLWQTALLAGLIWAADLILQRRGWPQVRYVLWLLVLARLLIPPSFALPTSLSARLLGLGSKQMAAVQPKALILNDALVGAASLSAVSLPAASSSVPHATFSAESWMMFGATAVSLFFLGWLLARFLRLRRQVSRAVQTAVPAHVAEAFAQHAAQLRLRRPPRLALTTSVPSAGVCGIFRPVLLLPESYRELPREQLGHIFMHEFAHLKRGDLIVNAIQSLLHIIYWFNPALWLASRRLRHLREVCCDATVANLLRERTREYGLTLLSAAGRRSQVKFEPEIGLLGLFDNPALLRRRIEYLAQPAWKHRRLRLIVAVSAVALVTLCIMPMAAVKAAPDTTQPEALSNTKINAPPSNAEANKLNPDVVKEGLGWRDARIGARRQEVLAAFGPSENSNPVWSYYRRRLGIDVFYDVRLAMDTDRATEIRFNPGFKYRLPTRIGIGSSMKEVFEAYGRPVDTKRVQDQSAGLFDSQVLYILPAEAKIRYEKLGVLFWFDNSNHVTQFVVFRARPSSPEGNASAGNGEAPTGLPADKQINDLNSKVAKLDIEKASREDVIAVFGEPVSNVWGEKTFTKDNLPDPYIMYYSKAFMIEMVGGQVQELRFEARSDYVFGDSLRVGSTLEDALKVIGPPNKTVEGGPLGFDDGVLYKNAKLHGNQSVTYYARRSQGVRIFLTGDIVNALYVTRKGPPLNVKVTPAQERDRIIDRTDYPFVDDPAVHGKWVSVDFVETIEQFHPGQKQWGSDLYLKELTFLDNGKMALPSNGMPWTWTKGLVINQGGKVAPAYTIKKLDGKNYLFFEWKSGDYSLGHMKPWYYVLAQAGTGN